MEFQTRRDLIKSLAVGGTSLFLNPQNIWSAASAPKKLRVALVGLGYYSKSLLAPALQQTKNCYLAGIVTGSPAKAQVWKEKYNIPEKNIYNYDNFDQIANNPDIDVVYIVLPNFMHHEYAIRAAKAGKHVWCEKPMALDVKQCQEMIEVCKKYKRTLAIGYRLQHEPTTQEYRRIVKRKLLGKVLSVNCAAGFRDGRTNSWRQKKELGGGALYDMGIYAIQGARLGTGMEPIAIVSATISTNRPEIYKNGLDETATALLEFSGGVLATIKTSFGENYNYLNITCEKGEIKMDPFCNYDKLKGNSPLGEINFPYNSPWQQAKQMDDNARAIMRHKSMLAPGEEGLKDIRIIEAIHKCAETGKRVTL